MQNVCFQAALLYTSSEGERRIRVHTLCLPISTNLSDIIYSADRQCIIGLLAQTAVDRSLQSSLSDAREALINAAVDALSSFKLLQSYPSTGISAPQNLKLLPLYIIALLKSKAFRFGVSTRLDDRVFAMCQLKVLLLAELIQLIHPDMYQVHVYITQPVQEIDGQLSPPPERLHLLAEKLHSRGAFLLDAWDQMLLHVGKNVHPAFCYNVFGVSSFAEIPEEVYGLPELATPEFIAPTEYMLRPPQPAVYLFIFDVSMLAIDSGYLSLVCNIIADEMSRLPGDARTQIGFLAVNSAVHFFSMQDNVSQPHQMIMMDVDDVFLSCPENLIINLKERQELLKELLSQLPLMFKDSYDTNCALGAYTTILLSASSPMHHQHSFQHVPHVSKCLDCSCSKKQTIEKLEKTLGIFLQ